MHDHPRSVMRYLIPLLFLVMGMQVLYGDPNKPISKSVPIMPRELNIEIAAAFFLAAIATGYLLNRKK